MSDAFPAQGPAAPGTGPCPHEDLKDEVETARRAALLSWITVAMSLLALLLVNGSAP